MSPEMIGNLELNHPETDEYIVRLHHILNAPYRHASRLERILTGAQTDIARRSKEVAARAVSVAITGPVWYATEPKGDVSGLRFTQLTTTCGDFMGYRIVDLADDLHLGPENQLNKNETDAAENTRFNLFKTIGRYVVFYEVEYAQLYRNEHNGLSTQMTRLRALIPYSQAMVDPSVGSTSSEEMNAIAAEISQLPKGLRKKISSLESALLNGDTTFEGLRNSMPFIRQVLKEANAIHRELIYTYIYSLVQEGFNQTTLATPSIPLLTVHDHVKGPLIGAIDQPDDGLLILRPQGLRVDPAIKGKGKAAAFDTEKFDLYLVCEVSHSGGLMVGVVNVVIGSLPIEEMIIDEK